MILKVADQSITGKYRVPGIFPGSPWEWRQKPGWSKWDCLNGQVAEGTIRQHALTGDVARKSGGSQFSNTIGIVSATRIFLKRATLTGYVLIENYVHHLIEIARTLLYVWKGVGARYVKGVARDELHFGHDLPWFKAAISITEENLRLCCAS